MITFFYNDFNVVLRSPDLNDSQDHVLGVQRKFNMLGQPYTWVPPINDARILSLTFRGLPKEKIFEFRNFLIQTSGKIITYIDPVKTSWLGRITSSQTTDTSEGANCLETVSIQFEGKHA